MGWDDIETAVKYIARCGALAEKDFEKVYGKKKESIGYISRRVIYITDIAKKLLSKNQIDKNNGFESPKDLQKSDIQQRTSVKIPKKTYEIYQLLIDKNMIQQQISKHLNLHYPDVNRSIKVMEKLGLIKPINPNANSIHYIATDKIPIDES